MSDPIVFLAVLAGAVMHASWNAVVKIGLDRFSSILLLALVQSGIALMLIPVFAVPLPGSWAWIAVAAVLHAGYKLFLIRAYEHGDLSQVYPVARGSAPLIVAVVAAVFLGELLTAGKFAAVLAIGLGVILMAVKGGGAAPSRTAMVYALITAGFTASYTLVDGVGARLAGDASGFTMWMFVGDGVCMVAYAAVTRGAAGFRRLVPAWRSGLLAGALSLGSYWVAIWAMTKAPIALVAALRETSVLFAMLIGVVFLRERAGPWRWAAAASIVTGVLLMRF